MDGRTLGALTIHGSEADAFDPDEVEHLLKLAQKMLERLGHTVVTRTGSPEALETFRSMPYRFDLLITKYTMPRMTGIELAREVKAIRPHMPVIICSGFNEAINAENASEPGIAFFLGKPYTSQTLARAMKQIIQET